MKHFHAKSLLLVFLLCAGISAALAQSSLIQKQQQSVMGGFGMTFIDGEPYYLFNIAPELAFGKFGVGLDINLRMGKNGKLRTEDFDEGYDYLRMIRYIRYGTKKEPIYVRLGVLDYSRLGHGYIMYNYRNSASYDLRKFGLEFDLDFEKFGFESVYSDFGAGGVFGLRSYVRPLQYTSVASVPIIGGFEVGLTYAADVNKDANKTWGDPTGTTANAKDGGSLGVIGFDFGLPLLTMPTINSTLYFDYAKISNFGSGSALGIDLNFSGLGVLGLGAKYERRWIGDQFVPSYFDALYEKERYLPIDTTRFFSKAQMLSGATKTEGYYGEILISILGRFNIVGGYQSPVGVRNQGILHLEFDPGDVIPGIILNAGYDKKYVGRVFKVDNNSLFFVNFGYKPMPFLFVSTMYIWTYTEDKDASGNVVGYKSQKRIEPKIGFVFNF